MSLDLHLTCNGHPVDLFQVPTYVTSMIMTSDNGSYLSKSNSLGVRNRYLDWITHLEVTELNSCVSDPKARKEISQRYIDHREKILSLDINSLNFYAL